MTKLVAVAVDEMQAALGDISTGKAAQQLMVALAYKDGVAVETLNKRYVIPQSARSY